MSKMSDPTPEDQSLVAAYWLTLQDSQAQWSTAQCEAWAKWIGDEANKAAYEETARFCAKLSNVPRPPLPTRAELLSDIGPGEQ